jgi:cardiolipin synthase A/B
MSTLKHKQKDKLFTKNKIKLIRSGKHYFQLLLELIQQAQENIHLQAYIFNDDETGQLIAEALKIAAKRNVSIYVLTDGYASKNISQKFIDELRLVNIQFRFFEPIFKSKYFYFSRRMHQKIMVVDAKYAVVGGMNIADRYNDLPLIPAWLDYAIHTEGPIAKEFCVLCWKTWNDFPKKMGLTDCEEKEISFSFDNTETSLVSMRRNDWVRRKNDISSTYVDMFRHANSHITIMCSYFIPGKIIRKLLSQASARGVKIKIIVAGESDVRIAKLAERWLYDWLLRHKIELYEYMPTVLHAKVAVCDGMLSTIGSYNINDISAYASIELNVEVKDEKFSESLEQTLQTIIINDCEIITKEKHRQRKNIIKQFIRWCSYKVFRIGFYAFTFYFKRKE